MSVNPVFDKIKAFLNAQNIPYRTMHHPPTKTSEDSAKYRGEALSKGAKAILLKVDENYLLFVFPADRKIDSKKIKMYLKARGMRAKKLRFATPDELNTLTGLEPGAVPPFGEPILPFQLYIDPALEQNQEIAFNAGSLTDSVFIAYSDYQKIAGGALFSFCQQ